MTDARRIYVPFQLAEGREIGNPIPYSGEIGGFAAELKRNEPYYALSLARIPSEHEAHEQFKKLIVSLYWVALETRSGLLVNPDLQKPYFPNDPIQAARNIFGENTDRRADVIVDGGQPAIFPDDKKDIKVTAQPIRAIASHSPSRLFDVLNEGMKLPNPSAVLETPKLKLAIDLYCLSHFRSSDFARFLVLCTVLETAAPDPPTSEPCVSLIDRWIIQACDAQSNATNGDVAEELGSLARRLTFLKTQSHRSRIRQYVKHMLDMNGDSAADKRARDARDLYDVRGELSHSGKYELGDGLSRLDEIVCSTLRAAMRHAHV